MTLLGALLVTALAGCDSEAPNAPAALAPPAPEAVSPGQLVHAIEWAFRYQSPQVYSDLLAADFTLACTAIDTAGNAYRTEPWTREDELAFFTALVAPERQPPILGMSLRFSDVSVTPDPRPGHATSQSHRRVQAGYVLTYTEQLGHARSVSGEIAFYAIRGDSVALPIAGPQPDPNLWYVGRWEDLDLDGEGWCSFRGR